MSLFCPHPFRNEPKALPDPKDMSIHRKGLSSQTKEKKAVKRFRTDPFQATDRFLDFFGIHLSQKGKAQCSFLFLDPTKNFSDPSRLLVSQPPWADSRNDRFRFRFENVLPAGESSFQSLISFVSILIVGVLRKNGLNENIERIPRRGPRGDAVLLFEKEGDVT